MRVRGEARRQGDGHQIEMPRSKQRARTRDAAVDDVVVRRLADGSGEGAREEAVGEAERGGKLVDGEPAVQPRLDEFIDEAVPPRG